MAGSLNKVIIIGRLGQDPEVRYTQSGQAVTSLNIATDESYTAQDGHRVDKTEWHRASVWGKQAEFCGNYLSKGRLVMVEGSLQTRKWQDKQGQDRYSTEINARNVQALDSKQNSEGSMGGTPRGNQNYQQNQNFDQEEDLGPAFPSEASGMDDIPF